MADRTFVAPSTTKSTVPASEALGSAGRATVRQYWHANVSDMSGHADEVRGFLRAAESEGYEPCLRKLFWKQGAPAGLRQSELERLERQAGRTPSGPTVAIHEYLPVASQFVVPQAVNVHRVMFETDRLPQKWLTPLLDRDELWVPCQFNADTFARSGIDPDRLKVLGGTLDFDRFAPGIEPLPLGASDSAFTFLTNFDFSERKGWRQLLIAWASAFGPDDDVCLVLKTGSFYAENTNVEARIDTFLRETFGAGGVERLAPLRILTERLPAAAMPRLYAGADAYVLASRGEGWGRPYMEAMAMGLPTIASRWSGNLEFMHDGNSWLIDGELVDIAEDAELFNDLYTGHKWFEPDVDALAAAMRGIASDPDAARAKAGPARDELIGRFGAAATAHRIDELATAAWERYSECRTKPVSVVVRGEFGSVDSLAVVNDALRRGLAARGHNVRLRQPSAKARTLPFDCATVSQSWPATFTPQTDGPTVMVLHWEFGAASQDWVDEVRRRVDRVWVASEFVRQGYIASGMPPGIVETIPCGADVELFTPDGPKYELPRHAGCTFLFVGGSTWRKGIDVLLEAWRRAFAPDDDVQLVIKDFGVDTSYKTSHNRDLVRAAAASPTFAPIVYIDDEVPHEQLPALYRAADVLVQPYRAEGFCLPAVEAMACGVPVIHNGRGPTMEFVGDVGGWSLPAERVIAPEWLDLPTPATGTDYYVHEVAPAQLAERMKAVAADPDGRRERGVRAVAQARNVTWEHFVERAEASLERLRAEGLPLARSLRRADVEGRSRFALFAPDWGDEAAWGPALDAWIAAFGPDDDVTLALYVDGDAEAIGSSVMTHLAGRDQARLPDLALVEPGEAGLTGLAATADAVLSDGAMDPAERPDLLRRARRILAANAGDVQTFADELRRSAV